MASLPRALRIRGSRTVGVTRSWVRPKRFTPVSFALSRTSRSTLPLLVKAKRHVLNVLYGFCVVDDIICMVLLWFAWFACTADSVDSMGFIQKMQ